MIQIIKNHEIVLRKLKILFNMNIHFIYFNLMLMLRPIVSTLISMGRFVLIHIVLFFHVIVQMPIECSL